MPENNDKKLYLLDAMALIYRAYFAMIRNPLVNSKGVNVSAISGFTNTLFELLRKDDPSHIAVVFDAAGPTERSESFEFYKANRQETPTDIIDSIPIIKGIITAFNIPCVELEKYEADDIIGTLAKRAEKDGYDTFMVTPDKDFGQLVSDHIFIYKPPYQGKGGFEKLGVREVLQRWDIERVDQVIDMLGLMGDKVDNIPGIPGVGEKTAAKLLKEYGTIENLLEHTDELKGKLKERVTGHAEDAIMSKQLATIIVDVPITVDEEDLVRSEPDKEKLAEIFNSLEFRALGKRIIGEDFKVKRVPAGGQLDMFGDSHEEEEPATEQESPAELKNLETTPHEYHLVADKEGRQALLEKLLSQKEFCFDTETTGLDPLVATLVGASFSWKAGEGYFVPVPDGFEGACEIMNEFSPAFADPGIRKIGQNLKYDMLMLRRYGIELKGELFDTMLAHYLIEPELRHNMDFLSVNYLGYKPVSITELIGKKGKHQLNMRDVELEKVSEYAAEDADITLQLKNVFEPALTKVEVEELFSEVEVPLMNVLADMEYEGVRLDQEFLKTFSGELGQEINQTRKKVFEQAGTEFNLDSPRQLGDVLFKKLEIPYKGRKTKTGQYSTNEAVLSMLAQEHAICHDIMNYRELVKLKSTYVDALPSLVNKNTGRLHTCFQQAVAVTGRLSSTSPNLQNIPIRTERGRRIRKAFIPRDDNHVLISADYSQVELRIIASLSKDEAMMEAFRNNEDIHTSTAARVFGVSPEEVDRNMRSRAKAVNFGIAYGQTAFGLAQALNINRTEAKGIIDNYFKMFPGVKAYMDSNIEFARKHGYAMTMKKRRRYLKDINARNATVRGFAERNAINMPIQGSAADMIKIAMIRVDREMREKKMQSKMTLQVHDELVFDAHRTEVDDLLPLIRENMKNALPLDVPVVVEIGQGNNWLEAH